MRPLILITNDDGVMSPGLHSAIRAVRDLGDVLVCAPRNQQTSMGRAFPKGEDIGVIDSVELFIDGDSLIAYGVHGSPAQAVSHGILEIAGRTPDLCISGINYGENVGTCLFPSGTVGAALEANTYGIPGIAVNMEANIHDQHSSDYNPLDWAIGEIITRRLAEQILEEGLAPDTALINVNIPNTANERTEMRVTRQSKQDYFIFERPGPRDFSKPLRLKTKIHVDMDSLELDSDIQAFAYDRVISVTPVSWDLTAASAWNARN